MESFNVLIGVLSATFLLASLSNALDINACLDRHNQYRNLHGAPPLKWDSYLVKHARRWATTLSRLGTLKRDPQKTYGEREGENLYIASNQSVACREAVDAWYNEYSRYRQAGACDSPPDYAPSFTNRFTQLVWQATERLGVAVVDGIVVARYHPPGNFPGEFATDVRCRNEKNQEIKVKRVNK